MKGGLMAFVTSNAQQRKTAQVQRPSSACQAAGSSARSREQMPSLQSAISLACTATAHAICMRRVNHWNNFPLSTSATMVRHPQQMAAVQYHTSRKMGNKP
jgi:hypothetical protein